MTELSLISFYFKPFNSRRFAAFHFVIINIKLASCNFFLFNWTNNSSIRKIKKKTTFNNIIFYSGVGFNFKYSSFTADFSPTSHCKQYKQNISCTSHPARVQIHLCTQRGYCCAHMQPILVNHLFLFMCSHNGLSIIQEHIAAHRPCSGQLQAFSAGKLAYDRDLSESRETAVGTLENRHDKSLLK